MITRHMKENACGALMVLGCLCATASLGGAQTADPELKIVDYPIHSGIHDGRGSEAHLAFEARVTVARVPWQWLEFRGFELGSASTLTFLAERDGGFQVLDTRSMTQWGGRSATFNGESVLVQLWVAPEDRGVFFDLARVVAAVPNDPEDDAPEISMSLCGSDNRVAITDNRVGRVIPPSCTVWRITNGAFLTAGHCVDLDPDNSGPGLPDGVLDVPGPVEFNVPASQANGTTVAAAPNDQYPVDTTSFSWRFDGTGQGLGKDWSVFAVFENSNTGLMPHEAYGFPYRITRESPNSGNTIRITGFGVDNTPVGTTGNRNAQNQTNQTHTGGYLSENTGGSSADIEHEYQVDTMGGNSGSPILWNSQNLAIGIHTNAGCSASNGNHGTSFEVNALESAINSFPGWGTEHVDRGHPMPVTESGSAYRPWDTVAEGVAAASSTGELSIVSGTYTEGYQLITKQLELEAPIGTVVIR